MGRLEGRVVLVTGSTKGIGRVVAIRAAAEGARVAVSGRSDDLGAEVVARIREQGGEATWVPCDVTDESSVEQAVARVVATYGTLDGLVANASGFTTHNKLDGPITEISLDGWRTIVDADLTSAFLTLKHGIAAMCAGSGGSVITVAGHVALEGINELDAFTAAKGGVVAITRSVASYYARYEVRCNCIAVGMVDSGGPANAAILADPARSEAIFNHSLGRIGTPEDIANVAMFLLSDESAFITGTVIEADGGSTSASHIARPDLGDIPRFSRKRLRAPK